MHVQFSTTSDLSIRHQLIPSPSPLTPSSKLRVTIMEMEGPTRIGAEREVK